MKKNNSAIFDVIIVGAGHGGLSVSYFLKKQNVNHLVFERGKIGESWRSQRWDSFALNTPNWMSMLPGDTYEGDLPDGFMHRDKFVAYLTNYAKRFQLPVKEGTNVNSVKQQPEEGVFEVNIENKNLQDHFFCRQLVLASGTMSAPKTPSISQSFPDDILQLHAASFRNHTMLPDGAVLVVGSGQSGCQITEDLLEAGRKVYLATSRVGRLPRRYRNKDILEWFILTKFLDVATETVTDPKILKSPQPQVSGLGRFGHTVSLQDLNRQGASIFGRLERVAGYEMVFSNNAADHVRFADEFSENFKKMIDDFIQENKIVCEGREDDSADLPDPSASCVEPSQSLNLKENKITSVIWTTGFTSDFSWISPSVTNEKGMPVHTNGISPVKGIYFIGFPWLKSRKSGIVYGMNEDAQYIAENIIRNKRTLAIT
jgi:putative flavoprotein involved in K+ transport